jgi:hypothetical protein
MSRTPAPRRSASPSVSFDKAVDVPADFAIVCLWALAGLMVIALVAAWVGSVDFADFLAAAG